MKKALKGSLAVILSVIMLTAIFGTGFAFANELPIPEYNVPQGLTATYGDYLHSVRLPDIDNGYFAWDSSYNRSTTVGNAGTNTFLVTYYPPNLNQFQTVYGIEVKIEVKKAKPKFTVPENVTGIVGKTLADIVLPEYENGTFAWELKSPENVLFNAEGKATYTVTFLPSDSKNYLTANNIPLNITVIKCTHTDMSEWTDNGDESFLQNGTKTRSCNVCGYTETAQSEGTARYIKVPVIKEIIEFFMKLFKLWK